MPLAHAAQMIHRKPFSFPVLLIGLTLCLAGYAGETAAKSRSGDDPPRTVVYVSLGGENTIAAFDMDAASGALKKSATVRVAGAPGSLAVSPDRKFLYAALRTTEQIAAFRIDPKNGGLKELGAIKSVGNPVYLAVDARGRFLLSAYYRDAKAAVHAIEHDGTVREQPVQVVETGKNPHSILADPKNRFVYVPNTGADRIQQFAFDEKTGRLTPLEPAAAPAEKGAGPRHFAFHPKLDMVLFVNEKNSTVSAYQVEEHGRLNHSPSSISTLPRGFDGPNTCADIHVTPDGRFVYASNRGHDSLACFKIDLKRGVITPVENEETEKTPREFYVEPGGRFVYAAGQASGRLAAYRIDPKSGELERFQTYDVGKGPAWVLAVQLPQ